ncbi:MAG: GFA family protein [Pseudomonadales bacterium]
MSDKQKGSCHCGAVVFEVELANGLDNLLRCNCSLCRRKGAIMQGVAKEKFHIIKGEDVVSLYQWNTLVAKHYFCSQCGIYTHHQRRSDPSQYGFNIACLDDYAPVDSAAITLVDGASLSVADD